MMKKRNIYAGSRESDEKEDRIYFGGEASPPFFCFTKYGMVKCRQ